MYEQANLLIRSTGEGTQKMKYRRSDYARYATLATLALSLTLTACTPAASTSTAASKQASISTQAPAAPVEEMLPTPEASVPPQAGDPSRVAVPASLVVAPVIATPVTEAPAYVPTTPTTPVSDSEPTTPAPQTPAPAPAVTPTTPAAPSTPPASPESPQTGTFTFPDGHISFELPAGWTVQTEEEPTFGTDHSADENHSVIANIYNAPGENVARVASGGFGGVVGGPVHRTILDSQKLPAFDSRDGASYFAFFRDDYPFEPSVTRYFMGVVTDDIVTAGPGSTSAHSFLVMDNGAASAIAHIDVSMTPDTAATWMETEQYSNLKALLTSIQYAE